MYKFSNGVVVFTEEDKEAFLKAGYVLVEDKNEIENNGGVENGKSEKGSKTTSRFQKRI